MYRKGVINTSRIRRITSSFGWIDHRFINEGFIRKLDSTGILLYLFLVTVADRYGLSFYADKSVSELLKIDEASISCARKSLVLTSLIDYKDGVYQVLELPSGRAACRSPAKETSRAGDILKEIFNSQGGALK